MFKPLMRSEIAEIVRIQIEHLQNMLKEKNITITVSEDAINWLATIGFEPQYGARPLKRVIQREFVNELSRKLLAGEISEQSNVHIDVIDDHVFFKNEPITVLDVQKN